MGFPGIVSISPGGELTQSANKTFALGTPGITPDGRRFRYSKAGEALSVGIPCQAAAGLGGLEFDTNAKLVTSITTYGTTANYLRVSTTWGSIGGSTGATKDLFKDGYCWISGSTGGQLLRVKTNTTGSSGTAAQYTDIKFREGERLTGAIDTSTLLAITRSPYDGVIEFDGLATQTGLDVGVPPRDITSAYYFWLQTGGVCPLMTDGTVVLGEQVSATTNTGIQGVTPLVISSTAGAIAFESVRRQPIGTVIQVYADTKFSLVNLRLD